MPLTYALLLDGGFLRYKLRLPGKPLNSEGITAFAKQVEIHPCVAGMRLHRIYFHDARPLEGICKMPLSGDIVDFGSSAAAARNKRMQAALACESFLALRFGELAHEGWRIRRKVLEGARSSIQIDAKDIEPNIRQKGVDMRIGLDIASLTLKEHVNVIVLVTGDSDFIPAMKFARREGSQLFLITMGHGIRDGMREHADLVIDTLPALSHGTATHVA